MKKLLLFTFLLTQILFPQLKEMEVKPTQNRGGIAIFRDFPDKAGIIFYTQYDNLTFYSSYGIHNVMGDPASGKYVVIVEPARQSLEIRCPGHKSEIIKLDDLQPRDELYYEVLPKKDEGIQGVTEMGITIQVTPSDAEIMIDGESFPHNKTKKISTGKHRLKIKKKDFVTYDADIIISTDMTLFQIELKYDVASTLVKVEGGTFQMGSNDGYSNEMPTHQVTVSSYLIGKFEVTQELWKSVVGKNPSEFKGDKRPVEQVSWNDIVEFCNKLSEKEGLTPAYTIINKEKNEWEWIVKCNFNADGYRLPTEAEWEYAARGGNKSKGYYYSGTNDINAVAWYESNSGRTTHEVGKKQPNELGIYDMSGNVEEWCWDWYGDYSSGSQTNPRGPSSGTDRVQRGGDCYIRAVFCDVAYRDNIFPDYRGGSCGFRLARTK